MNWIKWLNDLVKMFIDFIGKKKELPKEPPLENVSPVPLKQKTPWMDLALGNLGKKEGKDDKWIVSLFKFTSYKTDSSSTPWCAAFVSAMIEMTGYKSVKSASAKDQMKLGIPSMEIPGAVLVWRHKSGSLAGHYHTNFLVQKIDDKTYLCIGGNQGNAVSKINYSTNEYDLISCRMPVKS